MNCKKCGSELLEGDCICGICGAEVTVFLQNPVTESATPAFDEPEYKSIYPTYEEAERIRRQRRQEAPDISLNSFSKFINSDVLYYLEKMIIVISVALTVYCYNQNCFKLNIDYNGITADFSSLSNVKVKQLTYYILSNAFIVHFAKLMLVLSIMTILILFVKSVSKWTSLTIVLQLISTIYCIRSASLTLKNAKQMLPYYMKQSNLEQYDITIKPDIGIGYKLLILIAVLLSLSLIMKLLRFLTKSYKSGIRS